MLRRIRNLKAAAQRSIELDYLRQRALPGQKQRLLQGNLFFFGVDDLKIIAQAGPEKIVGQVDAQFGGVLCGG